MNGTIEQERSAASVSGIGDAMAISRVYVKINARWRRTCQLQSGMQIQAISGANALIVQADRNIDISACQPIEKGQGVAEGLAEMGELAQHGPSRHRCKNSRCGNPRLGGHGVQRGVSSSRGAANEDVPRPREFL